METEIEQKRPVGRPRKEDVAIHSAGRSGPIRERKRKGGQLHDPFRVDDIPSGSSYEWKRHTVFGKEDPTYTTHMREQGWEPVDSARHPELVADGYRGPIIRDGLMLMERPIELTEEARAEDNYAAREAIEIKKRQMNDTPSGTLPRDAHPGTRPSIRTSYESLPIDE